MAFVSPVKQMIFALKNMANFSEIENSDIWPDDGKNREIRKVCKFVGLEVNRLIRTSYGPFDLADLKKEEIREVSSVFLKNNFKKHFYL